MGNRGFRGGEKHNIKQIVKKKSEKAAKSEKSDIFFTENGLKCIRNPTKHTFKIRKYVKKPIKSAKSEKNQKNLIFPT